MPEYLVFDQERIGPQPAAGVARAALKQGRANLIASLSTAAENRIEESGLFRWYRDRAGKADPRARRRGVAHPFGVVSLDLSAAQAGEVRRRFPQVKLLRNTRVRPIRSPRVLGTVVPSVTAADLWHLSRTGVTSRIRTGRGAVVAVVDTGVDATHPEFSALSTPITSFAFHPDSGATVAPGPDSNGHGTHVAGLVCGRTCGIAPDARLINIQIFSSVSPKMSVFLKAVAFVATHPEIDVVNISLGITDPQRAFAPVIDKLFQAGVLPVCAVGNSGAGKADSPGDFNRCITAGYINKLGAVETNSGSKSITENGTLFTVPDLVAPGAGVFSARSGGSFEQRSGSSMASAIVSGLAALQVERSPSITVHQLAGDVLGNVVSIGGNPARTGRGLAVA